MTRGRHILFVCPAHRPRRDSPAGFKPQNDSSLLSEFSAIGETDPARVEMKSFKLTNPELRGSLYVTPDSKPAGWFQRRSFSDVNCLA
jgi:hypothetical protein